jgi:hypothetical protein
MSDISLAREYFGEVDVAFFHLTSLAAVPFRSTKAFTPLCDLLEGFDRKLLRMFPWCLKYAWISVWLLASPRKNADRQFS